MTENLNTTENKISAKMIAKMGMMAAIACVFGLFRFPILPMVPFLTYDFADIPIIISAFAFGPVAGILITFVVSFIQAFLLGGDQLYGFIMHILASGTFVLIASLIYKARKSKKVAIISMIIATIAMIVIMGIANYFITPYYYGGAAMKEVVVQLMPFILLFNLIKGVANSVITFVIYKRISPFLHKQ
ncbi:MAG: ECF transporter S component [Clostridia bacterium]|nr:ECF transporter S component [Clostridia bacterium]